MTRLLFSLILFQFFSSTLAAEQEVKIGVILPLSGIVAEHGTALQNGIELARQDFPEALSAVNFIYEDVSYSNTDAVSAFNRLTSMSGISLAYVWGVPFNQALAPIAESRKFPLIAQSFDKTVARDKKYVIRFASHTGHFGKELASYLSSKSFNKIAAVVADNSYTEEMLDGLIQNLRDDQTLQVVDRTPFENQDFRSVIARLKGSDYDVVGVFLGPGQTAQFFRQKEEHRLTMPAFTTQFAESNAEIRLSNGALNGAFLSSAMIMPEFIEKYRTKYGEDSQVLFAAHGYEFARLVGILKDDLAQATSSEEVLSAFENAPEIKGIAMHSYKYKNEADVGKYFAFPTGIKWIVDDQILDREP